MTTDIKALIDDYTRWLRAGITILPVGDAFEITTPFLDRHNDHLQIYVRQETNRTLLTDDGYIIADLRQSGCTLDTEHRKRLLASILNGFGVQRDGDALVTFSHNGDFPQRKHAMVQAMLAVGDLFATAQSHVKSLFLEDVGDHLERIGARAFPDFQLVGKTGFQHKFDFAISKSAAAPERLLRALNRPSRQEALLVIAAWNDVRASRAADAQMLTLLNDSDHSVSGEVVDALRQYQIEPILWSRRAEFTARLAA